MNDRERICGGFGLLLETISLCLYIVGSILFVTLWETKLPRKAKTEEIYNPVDVNDDQ
jgi:hypothetical protein